jgi:hypothetical protein
MHNPQVAATNGERRLSTTATGAHQLWFRSKAAAFPLFIIRTENKGPRERDGVTLVPVPLVPVPTAPIRNNAQIAHKNTLKATKKA